MVNTPQGDGLAHIPGLTPAPYKTHPQPLNSVPPCLIWRIGFGRRKRLTIWWIEITNCPSTKEIWLTYQIRENCWYKIILFFSRTGTASTYSKSGMAAYQYGVVAGGVGIILLCLTSITSKHTNHNLCWEWKNSVNFENKESFIHILFKLYMQV